ncbi:MAG: TlpA disulfide reductase family protein [Thermoanaerobaculia bacterium]
MIFRKAAGQRHAGQGNRRRELLASVLVLLILTVFLVPTGGHAQGRPYKLEGLQGGTLGPADFAQGVVIAVVWASWSPHCRNIVSQVDAIAATWGSQAKVISVNFQEDRAEAEAFLSGVRPKAPVYLDQSGAFSKAHSVTNLPGLVIFKDGAAAFSGKLSRDPDSIISQTLG